MDSPARPLTSSVSQDQAEIDSPPLNLNGRKEFLQWTENPIKEETKEEEQHETEGQEDDLEVS